MDKRTKIRKSSMSAISVISELLCIGFCEIKRAVKILGISTSWRWGSTSAHSKCLEDKRPVINIKVCQSWSLAHRLVTEIWGNGLGNNSIHSRLQQNSREPRKYWLLVYLWRRNFVISIWVEPVIRF